MTLAEAIERLVPRPVEAFRREDVYGLTVDLYPTSRYEMLGDWLIVGDDAADKIGAAIDGRGLYFLRGDGERFVNSTVALLRSFVQIYVDAHEEKPDADLDEICRHFRSLDPPAMAPTATWFNFLDMVRNYP